MTADLLDDVLSLHARGFAVVPMPYGQKRPVTPGWQDLRLDVTGIRTAFGRPSNVGVVLGTPSGGLVDIDLDGPKAQALGHVFLPRTELVSGRTSAPASHWFFLVESPVKTTKYIDPLATSGGDRAMLVELRASGAQTLVPPSVHPSGEPITWAQNGEPAEVDADLLLGAVARVAAGAMLARYWPTMGSRHQAALALGGGLLRAGWAAEAADFVWHIAQVAGDEEAEDRRQAVHSTADALAAGEHVTGWPMLSTLVDPRVVDAVRKWLGISAPNISFPTVETRRDLPPPFPVTIFPPAIATFIQAGATAFGIPPDFIAIPLLGFAAGVIGNLRAIELKPGWTERAILWTGVVGRPGSGKSPGMDYAQRLIHDLQQRAWSTYQTELEAWRGSQGEGKVGKLAARVKDDAPALESYYTTDATIEALGPIVTSSPGVCLVRDELVGWVKAHDAYRQGGDRQTWLSLWAGSAIKVDRKTGPTAFIPTPSVSVTGGLQPDRLPDLRDAAGRDDGFVDRLLLGWPEAPATRWTDAEVDPAVVRDAQRVFALLRNRPDGTRRQVSLTRFDTQARARFVTWHDANADLVTGAPGLAAGWAAKYPRQTARVALVLHALHHPDAPLTPTAADIVDGAITAIEYFRAHLPPILARFGQVGTDLGSAGHVSRVAALLRSGDGRWVSRTELHAGLGRNLPAQELTTALRQLEDESAAERRMVPTEGRSREEWRHRKNEVTKKGAPEPDLPVSEHPSFVTSFLRKDSQSEFETCCICNAPLADGRRYQCEACTAEGVRRDAERFGHGGQA